MKADNAKTVQTDTLSDKELNAVSGGKHQVSKAQYELLLEIRMMFAKLK